MGSIRVATAADAKGILEIYAPFCMGPSPVSFETVAPSLQEMEKRIVETLNTYPWLVYEQDNKVLGYAYATQHSPRAAYDWAVDVSIYMAEQARGQGNGKKLYKFLFEGLRTLGYYNAYAGIGLPNEPSRALHTSCGFTLVGVFNNIGFKAGAWRDVAWYGLKLQAPKLNPEKPIKFSQLGL
jgi:L-amino acid N-acyltransferase YncA